MGREAAAVQARVAAAAAARSKLVVDTRRDAGSLQDLLTGAVVAHEVRRRRCASWGGERQQEKNRGLTRLGLASSPFFSIAARATRQRASCDVGQC